MEWFDSLVESFGWGHFWLVLAVALAIVEALTITFFTLPFALGALIAALCAWIAMPVTGQWFVFGVSSFIMLFVIQIVVRNYLTSPESEKMKTNAEALIGREALVVDPIKGSVIRGAVKVGGETWSAIAEDDQGFEKDDVVLVTSLSGATLTVAALGSVGEEEKNGDQGLERH